jgi:hypothetical protein
MHPRAARVDPIITLKAERRDESGLGARGSDMPDAVGRN